MRCIIDVIDQIVAVAPDLKDKLSSARDSILYSAPEMIPHQWQQVIIILTYYASDHPERAKIQKILSGS